MSILKDLAKRAEFIFGMVMNPCPKCQSYNLVFQTPIKMAIEPRDSARQILREWARQMKHTGGQLLGPVYLMCRACGHKGPAVDCSGRTSDEVGRDPNVSAEVKRLWNSQGGLR